MKASEASQNELKKLINELIKELDKLKQVISFLDAERKEQKKLIDLLMHEHPQVLEERESDGN